MNLHLGKGIRRVMLSVWGNLSHHNPPVNRFDQMETQEYDIQRFSWRGAEGPMGKSAQLSISEFHLVFIFGVSFNL